MTWQGPFRVYAYSLGLGANVAMSISTHREISCDQKTCSMPGTATTRSLPNCFCSEDTPPARTGRRAYRVRIEITDTVKIERIEMYMSMSYFGGHKDGLKKKIKSLIRVRDARIEYHNWYSPNKIDEANA